MRGNRGALLVGQDLGVAEPGVVADRGVHVVVAPAPLSAGSFVASAHPPAAAVGDLAGLLDVNVSPDHRTARGRSTTRSNDARISMPVAGVQHRHGWSAILGQDPGHGPRWHPRHLGDPVPSDLRLNAAGQHRRLDLDRGVGRARTGPARPAMQTCQARRRRIGPANDGRTDARHPSPLRHGLVGCQSSGGASAGRHMAAREATAH